MHIQKTVVAGIYLHIPFCKKRCAYCDFFSSTQSPLQTAYIEALCNELIQRKKYLQGEEVNTVYWGGGTPSQLNKNDFVAVFETLSTHFNISQEAEITLEANPDDLTDEYVGMLRTLPFNRISMGIQTFNDELLRCLERRHTAQQAREAVMRCQRAGFSNISIDLMYGLPSETVEIWQADLKQAVALHVQHISAYLLSYEKGTKLERQLRDKVIQPVDEERCILFYSMLMDELSKAGYNHYEISNFALQGCESRHNSSYWEGIPYLGCGAAAHSFDVESRQWNVSSLPLYINDIKNGKPVFEREVLDTNTKYNDAIITRLRTAKGLSLKLLQMQFGEKLSNYFLQQARPFIEQHLLENNDNVFRLTRQGIMLSDSIFRELIVV